MSKRAKTTIGLFARGKEIGFAVAIDGELTRYGIKTVTGKRMGTDFRRRVASILDDLCEAERPTRVIVPDVTLSGALSRAVHRWAESPRNAGRGVRRLSMREVKRRLYMSQNVTLRELETIVVERHPILRPLAERIAASDSRYGSRALLAAALIEAARCRPRRDRPPQAPRSVIE